MKITSKSHSEFTFPFLFDQNQKVLIKKKTSIHGPCSFPYKALNYYYWGKRSKTVEYYEKIKNKSTDFPKLKYHTHDLEKKLKLSS